MQGNGIIERHFNNVSAMIGAIYANGGVRVGGYGCIGSGYGGGIDIGQAHMLMWLDGYLAGLGVGNRREAHTLMAAINQRLMSAYPSEVNSGNLPFINLNEAD